MTLAPQIGSYVQIAYGTGEENDYSSEAMEEVDMSSADYGFLDRYTVYRIADSNKRVMTDSATPVFQKRVHGTGDWTNIDASAYTVWYGAGYIVLDSPLNSDDTVRCYSGKYMVPNILIGCSERQLTLSRQQVDVTCFGDSAYMRSGTVSDWKASLTAFYAKRCAEVTTESGPANSHVRIIHASGGTSGNGATIDFQDNNSSTLSVSVVDDDIVVDLKTVDGSPVSTALEVIGALNSNEDFIDLGMRAELAPAENGTGIVADSGPYTLSGGSEEIDFDSMMNDVVAFRFYDVYCTGKMFVGFGQIESIEWQGGPGDVLKCGLSVVGAKYPIYRVKE